MLIDVGPCKPTNLRFFARGAKCEPNYIPHQNSQAPPASEILIEKFSLLRGDAALAFVLTSPD
jgi:hypothetical protein